MSDNGRKDEAHMREALAIARQSAAEGGRPFGAIVVMGGATIGCGRDRSRVVADPTHHAETAAIREAVEQHGRERLPTATIFASCEPCVMCAGAILRSGIRVVRYASSREAAADAGYPDVCSPDISRDVLRDADVQQLLRSDGEALLREYPLAS